MDSCLQSGSHAETVRFGSFEEHTRGIGSKLMVGMGYVKGAALGRHPGGQLHPIQVSTATLLHSMVASKQHLLPNLILKWQMSLSRFGRNLQTPCCR